MSLAVKFLIRYNTAVFGCARFARRHVMKMSRQRIKAALAQVREFAALTDLHTRLGE